MSHLTNVFISIYLVCAFFIAFYTCSHIVILVLYFLHSRRRTPLPEVGEWPGVVIQLPLYNERHVVKRLINAMAALDYPRDKLLIQILDDSTDDTPMLIAECLAGLRDSSLKVEHVRRANRVGYKAGALAYGLTLLPPDIEYAAIFDADFVPPPDFLRRTVPYFTTNPQLGIVQTRWGHLNANENLLTRAQSLSIDAHFAVEQVARNRSGLLLTFNGTGGLWRIKCIEEAGGWSADTLCEDLDLSYRAQIKGWRYLFVPDVVVPGEIPPNITAYKTQQFRWSKGCNQALVKLFGQVWHGRLTLPQRIMATQHLIQYLPHLMALTMLLLTPPLIMAGVFKKLPIAPLSLLGIVPPLMHVTAQSTLYTDWPRRLLAWPIVMLVGTGIMVNNARAAFSAFVSAITHHQSEFVRTPKFGGNTNSAYKVKSDRTMWIELGMALYALVGVFVARRYFPSLSPYMALHVVAFGTVAVMSMREQMLLRRTHRKVTVKVGV